MTFCDYPYKYSYTIFWAQSNTANTCMFKIIYCRRNVHSIILDSDGLQVDKRKNISKMKIISDISLFWFYTSIFYTLNLNEVFKTNFQTTKEQKLKVKFNKNQWQWISHITTSKETHPQPFCFESLNFWSTLKC